MKNKIRIILSILVAFGIISVGFYFLYPLQQERIVMDRYKSSPLDKGVYLNYSYSRCAFLNDKMYVGSGSKINNSCSRSFFDCLLMHASPNCAGLTNGRISILSEGGGVFNVHISCSMISNITFKGNGTVEKSYSNTFTTTIGSTFMSYFVNNCSVKSTFMKTGSLLLKRVTSTSQLNFSFTSPTCYTRYYYYDLYSKLGCNLDNLTELTYPYFFFDLRTSYFEPVNLTPTEGFVAPNCEMIPPGCHKDNNVSYLQYVEKRGPKNFLSMQCSDHFSINALAFTSGYTTLIPYLFNYNRSQDNLFCMRLTDSNVRLGPTPPISYQTSSKFIFVWLVDVSLMAIVVSVSRRMKRNTVRERDSQYKKT